MAAVIEVTPGLLSWADNVSCTVTGSRVEPKVQDFSAANVQICFLNEARVRNGKLVIDHYVMDGSYHDDGPPALDQILEGCRLIEEFLKAGKKVTIISPEGNVSHRHFSALITAAHPLLLRGETTETALAPWASLDISFLPNSWLPVSKPLPGRDLPLAFCLKALEVAREKKWLDVSGFDAEAYHKLCMQWDASWVIPKQILLLADPVSTVADPDPATVSHLTPSGDSPNFIDFFNEEKVKFIVRLNKMSEHGLTRSYNSDLFRQAGFTPMFCAYDDTRGGVPSKEIVSRILKSCSQVAEGNAAAFHCKAGFGRSGVCAALLVMYLYDVPGDALVAWLRICRPGTITTPNQFAFLKKFKGREDLEKEYLSDACCTIS